VRAGVGSRGGVGALGIPEGSSGGKGMIAEAGKQKSLHYLIKINCRLIAPFSRACEIEGESQVSTRLDHGACYVWVGKGRVSIIGQMGWLCFSGTYLHP
jgi:hypothetical protein